MAPPKVTDRNGNVLQKGDIVLVEAKVSDIFLNPTADREIALTSSVEGVPAFTAYANAAHVIKKDSYSAEGGQSPTQPPAQPLNQGVSGGDPVGGAPPPPATEAP